MERWIEKGQISVLDHGFIRVIDYMGDDSAVVQAARVSYGAGTKSVRDDRALIRYLMRHRHSSPFEMCEIKVHVKLPIFIARQWIRHRTACLAGDVPLSFDLPGANDLGRRRHYTMTVKEIFEKWQPTKNRLRPDKQKNSFFLRNRIQGMMLRSVNEETGEIYHTHITDIWSNGVKDVWKVTLSDGRSLRATLDHQVFTADGWTSLREAIDRKASLIGCGKRIPGTNVNPFPAAEEMKFSEWRPVIGFEGKYEVSSVGAVRSLLNTRGKPLSEPILKIPTFSNGRSFVSLSNKGISRSYLVSTLVLEAFSGPRPAGMICRHLDDVPTNNRLDNLVWGTHKENAMDRMLNVKGDQRLTSVPIEIIRADFDGEEETFDLSVSGPYHNFIAGGVCVHNSVNEISARYSILDREFYLPAPEDLAVQSSSNRQGRGELIDPAQAAQVFRLIRESSVSAYDRYEELLNDAGDGTPVRPGDPQVARELSRMVLSLNHYTQWYWKVDLHNLFHFLSLRADPHAQLEIRRYADVLMQICRDWVPSSIEAFEDFRLHARTFSREELLVLKDLLDGVPFDQAVSRSNLSKREVSDLRSFCETRS